jgi:hypothetical protein
MLDPKHLPLVLRLNALSSAAFGVLLAAAPEPVGAMIGLDPFALRVIGIALLPFAAFALHVARDPRPTLVRAVSALDFAWVAGSVGLVVWGDLTGFGIAVVLVVAAAVDAFGMLQLLGARAAGRMIAAS